MSDSCMYEFEDIWDDLCQSDDHIVPRPVDDSHKKPHREVTSIPYNAEARSSAGNVDQGSEKKSFSSLSKRKYKMLERDSRSHTPSGVISSSADGDTINEASSLVSKKTTFSSHVFENGNSDSHNNEVCVNDDVVGDGTAGFDNNSTDPLGNITHTDNDLDIFENAEVKDSSDFLYYGWPEIENFEDVDRIFRSCDSTFGLGASRENELGWFSSSDNVGGAEELVNSDFGFSCPESSSVENFPMNHDYLKSHCSNDTAMMTVPIRLKDGPWISEKPESYVSFVNGPTSVNDNEGFTPNAHVSIQLKVLRPAFGLTFHSGDSEPLISIDTNVCSDSKEHLLLITQYLSVRYFLPFGTSHPWGWRGMGVSNSAESINLLVCTCICLCISNTDPSLGEKFVKL